MTNAIYTTSIPVFKQMLGGLKDVLRIAEAHATAKKIDPNALPGDVQASNKTAPQR